MSASYDAIFPSLRTVAPPSAPPREWASTSDASGATPTGESFAHDVMEIFNPLQHVPIVSVIYRQMTGDKIEPMERIAGDTLYGGVIGLVSSVANVAFEKLTGKDFGDTALAMLGIDQNKPTEVAAGAPAVQPAVSPAADTGPANLISVASNTDSSSTAAPMNVMGDSTLLNSLNRGGIGLDLGSSAKPAATATTLDTNTDALLASLDHNGIGLDLNSAAVVTPLVSTATRTSALDDANADALMSSLNRDGIGTDMSLRAMYAYRKSLSLPAAASSADATLH